MTQSPVDRFLVLFPSIVFEAMPFIIVGALFAGFIEEFLPQRFLMRWMPKRRYQAVAASALLGLALPMCECGIVVVMRRLLGKGLPLSCAVAYMLAAPIINPIVISSTAAAFSGDRTGPGGDGLTSFQMVALRCGLAFITAFTVAMIVDRLSKKHGTNLVRPLLHGRHLHQHLQQEHEHSHECGEECGHEHTHHHHEGEEHEHLHASASALQELPITQVHDPAAAPELVKKSWWQRLVSISETTLHDFIDIACFLTLGAFIAAAVQTMDVMSYVPAVKTNPFLAAPTMMLLAILLCLCSEADAFVAANLIAIPLAGKIAFLVLGPMLDLKLYFMYTRVFRARLIWTIIPSVFVMVLVLSLATHCLDATARQRGTNTEPAAAATSGQPSETTPLKEK